MSDGGAFDDLSADEERIVERLVDRLEEGWRDRQPIAIEALLAGTDALLTGAPRVAAIGELVFTEIEWRARAGAPLSAAVYLERFPELAPVAHELSSAIERSSSAMRVETDGSTPNSSPSPPRSAADALPATSLPARLGKFELLELIGKGSFGRVYRACDRQLGREVAIKVPSRTVLAEGDGDRFLREGQHLARLEHPAIVPVFEAGRAGETYYLACGLLRGGTLRDRLRGGALDWRLAAEIAARLAEALAAAHAADVVHRDVTSSNVLFDEKGQAFLSDFGLARSNAQATLTHVGDLLGTPAYMPPERVLGERRVDARGDVYSLGVVLYEMLTGRLPFFGHAQMVFLQILHEEPRRPRRLDARIPLDLENICLKAMTKEASGRYESAAALAIDLRHCLAGEPVSARPLGAAKRAMRWCRRRPALAGLGIALLLAVFAGFSGVTWQWRRAEAHLRLSQQNVRQAHAAIDQLYSAVAEAGKDDPESWPLRRKLLERSIEYYRDFLRQLPDDAALRADAAYFLFQIAFATYTMGDKEHAQEALLEALPLWEQLAEERGDDRETLYFLGKTYYMLGLLPGPEVAKLRWYDKTRVVREKLVRLFPGDDSLLHELVEIQDNLGRSMFACGDREKGFEAVKSALEQRRRLVERHPRHSEYGRRLADTQCAHARMLNEQGRLEEAETSCRKAVSVAAHEVAAGRGMPYSATTQAQAFILLTRILANQGDMPRAREYCRQAVEILEPLAGKYPSLSKVRELQTDAMVEMQKIDSVRVTTSTGK